MKGKASRGPILITVRCKSRQVVAVPASSGQAIDVPAKFGMEPYTPPLPRRVFVKTREPERRLVGRGVATPAGQYPMDACLCTRPKAIVFCNGCGYFRIGRKKILCPHHPSVQFLYDIETCLKCNASFYLDEHQL